MFLPQFIISANKNLKYKEFSPLTHRHISPFLNTMCDFFFFKMLHYQLAEYFGTLFMYDVLSHQSNITSNSERTPMYVFSLI